MAVHALLEFRLNQDGTQLYASLREDDAVAAYETATGMETRRPLLVHPNSMALDAQ